MQAVHSNVSTQFKSSTTPSVSSSNPSTDKRFIRLAEVMNLTGLCRATVYHYIKLGGFPAPAKFGKSSLWEYHEIQAWINQRLEERQQGQSR